MIPQSKSKAWLSNNTNVNWKHKNVSLAKTPIFEKFFPSDDPRTKPKMLGWIPRNVAKMTVLRNNYVKRQKIKMVSFRYNNTVVLPR